MHRPFLFCLSWRMIILQYQVCIYINNDILWKQKSYVFIVIILGTSVPVERIFSSAKHTIPPLRSSLKPDTIISCMLEKHRLKHSLLIGNMIDDELSWSFFIRYRFFFIRYRFLLLDIDFF
jgi:hypothetical protein